MLEELKVNNAHIAAVYVKNEIYHETNGLLFSFLCSFCSQPQAGGSGWRDEMEEEEEEEEEASVGS